MATAHSPSPAPDPPYRGITARQVSLHAAAQWCRRVRLDPVVLAWSPRAPIPALASDAVPRAIATAIAQAVEHMVLIAEVGRFTRTAPDWLTVNPERDGQHDAYLELGDIAYLLGRGRASRATPLPFWIVNTVVTRHGLESPYARAQRIERRLRQFERRHPGEDLGGPRRPPHRAYRRLRPQQLASLDVQPDGPPPAAAAPG